MKSISKNVKGVNAKGIHTNFHGVSVKNEKRNQNNEITISGKEDHLRLMDYLNDRDDLDAMEMNSMIFASSRGDLDSLDLSKRTDNEMEHIIDWAKESIKPKVERIKKLKQLAKK